MNNKMFITRRVLDKQVQIMKNQDIPIQLKSSDDYVYRHLGNSDQSVRKQLDLLELNSIEDLMNEVVPDQIRLSPEDRFQHDGKVLESIDSETLMLERMR